MSSLINQLKTDHQRLSLMLGELNRLGIFSCEGQAILGQIKNLFLKHLEKEDDELFPILEQLAKNNPTLKRKLQILSVEVKHITEKAFDFFKKYETGTFALEFANDFKEFFSLIIQHITKEERVIYTEYDSVKAYL